MSLSGSRLVPGSSVSPYAVPLLPRKGQRGQQQQKPCGSALYSSSRNNPGKPSILEAALMAISQTPPPETISLDMGSAKPTLKQNGSSASLRRPKTAPKVVGIHNQQRMGRDDQKAGRPTLDTSRTETLQRSNTAFRVEASRESASEKSSVQSRSAESSHRVNPAVFTNRVVQYNVTVVTSRMLTRFKGPVSLTVFGDRADSGERWLTKSSLHDLPLQSDQIDQFSLDCRYLGYISVIRLSVGRALETGWFVDSVLISDDQAHHYLFQCSKWLCAQNGDGQTTRDFACSKVLSDDDLQSVVRCDVLPKCPSQNDTTSCSCDCLSLVSPRSDRSRDPDLISTGMDLLAEPQDNSSEITVTLPRQLELQPVSDNEWTHSSEDRGTPPLTSPEGLPQGQGRAPSNMSSLTTLSSFYSSTEDIHQDVQKTSEQMVDGRFTSNLLPFETDLVLAPSPVGDTLFTACEANNVNRVSEILTESPQLVGDINNEGMTALHCAAVSGSAGVVRVLAEQGACLDTETPTGFLAVHLAAMHGHREVLETLVSLDCDVDAPSTDLMTPLHVAAMSGHASCVAYLLSCGANPDKVDMNGRTAFDVAEEFQHSDVAEVLAGC